MAIARKLHMRVILLWHQSLILNLTLSLLGYIKPG